MIFQFFDPEEKEARELLATAKEHDVSAAMDALYHDLIDLHDRAREEVTIPRSDGRRQRYAAVRFRRQVESGRENNELVPTVSTNR